MRLEKFYIQNKMQGCLWMTVFVVGFFAFSVQAQAATAIYYSVGQNTTSHETGSGTVTVDATNRTATFSVAQTAINMGVGNLITYTGGSCYVTSKTSTSVWGCQSATGTDPIAATDADVTSIAHAYNSLSAAETGAPTLLGTSDLVAGNFQLNFPCYYDTGADTTAVTVDGYISGVNNFIKIYTPNNITTEVNQSQRHSGKWDDEKYRLETTNSTAIGTITNYVRFEGLQIKVISNNSVGSNGINLNGTSNTAVTDLRVSNTIIQGVLNAGTGFNSHIGIKAVNAGNSITNTVKINNNLVYGFLSNSSFIYGIWVQYANAIIYNNTLYGDSIGIFSNSSYANTIAINNIIQNCTDGYNDGGGIFNALSNYNISDLVADAPGANSKNSTTVAFADAANRDLHLSPFDTSAKNAGADLSADPNFTFNTDIDGQTRPSNSNSTWDIGADEAATAIYYSVGQNTTSHETGSGTVTVDATNRTATFSVAQTATNMGVGDLIAYTGGGCYVTSKTSTSVWGCQSATGTDPIAATDADVTSIAHAYNSLSAAEAGAPTLLGTSDLVAGNFQLNFPCYYDTGADTTAVTVDGYTSSSSNFIKIYTPNNVLTEVNQSQRHSGKWDDKKYNISVTNNYNAILVIFVADVSIDGLQLSANTTNEMGIRYLHDSNRAERFLHNSIIKNTNPAGAYENLSIPYTTIGNYKYLIENNIFIGNRSAMDLNYCGPTTKVYIYNNTAANAPYFSFRSANAYIRNLVLYNVGYLIDNGGAQTPSTVNVSNIISNVGLGFSTAGFTGVTENQPIAFADAVNDDFHLSSGDTTAKNKGIDLSVNPDSAFHVPISIDIDGQIRPNGNAWDIGADEGATAVYYSVGQSVSDLKTTANPTLSITTGAGVFSAAQTGNIGVGDRVTYNTNQIAYISAKTNVDGMHWSLVTATGSTPADITDSVVVSILHEYTSLAAALAGSIDANHLNTTNLETGNFQLNFPCYYDSGADTTAVTVSGFTTSVANYIKIYTPNNTTTEANKSQRHQGKATRRNYTLNPSGNSDAIKINISQVRISGLEITDFGNNGFASFGINFVQIKYITIDHNYIHDEVDLNNGAAISGDGASAGGSFVYNNIVSNITDGIRMDNWSGVISVVYNNTVNSVLSEGYSSFNSQTIFKNNIAQNCRIGYSGNLFNSFSSNNISSDATAPGANSKINTNISFADAANKDFHLSPFDTSAKNAGADLSADPNFTFNTDIDGQTRPSNSNSTWDIGADEAATAIFYSVGQNTTSHETGSGTVTVDATNRTATFSVAQAAINMGVGDLITYTGGSCYVTSKTSTTVWGCQSATGTDPAAATDADVTSIAHAYNSLSAAEAGAPTLLGTSDLVAGNFQLNFPCYYDGGADTTVVTVNGYTTGVSNFINIYTPTNTNTEVNQSQRHSGKWDDGKFTLTARMNIANNYIKLEGLQIKANNENAIFSNGPYLGLGQVVVDNILWGTGFSVPKDGIFWTGTNTDVVIANNVVYGFNFSGSFGIRLDQGLGSIYSNVFNNTAYDNATGIYQSDDAYSSNNISYNNAIDYEGTPRAGSTNNLSKDATATGANAKINQTVSFLDALNKDFHLLSTDTSAHDAGVDLSADPNFAFDTDIDGDGRIGSWDIGADELKETQIEKTDPVENIESGLVGHWTFDGGDVSASTAKDVSGNGNEGTISGATPAIGKLGQAMSFNGVASYVNFSQVSNLPAYNLANKTVSFWVKGSVGQFDKRVFSESSTVDFDPLLTIGSSDGDTSKLKVFIRSDDGTTLLNINSMKTIFDNSWHFISWIDNNGMADLYVDGVKDGANFNYTRSLPLTLNRTSIGAIIRSSISNYFNGLIDDVHIHNRTLSQNEINILYHQGQITVRQSGTTIIKK